MRVRVVERLEAEIAVAPPGASGGGIRALKLTGSVRAKSDAAAAAAAASVAAPGASLSLCPCLRLSLAPSSPGAPAQIVEAAVNTASLDAEPAPAPAPAADTGTGTGSGSGSGSGSGGEKLFVLRPKDPAAFARGDAALDLVRYRVAPSFRPLLVLARCLLALATQQQAEPPADGASTNSSSPSTSASSSSSSSSGSVRAKLRVEVDFNKALFLVGAGGGGAGAGGGGSLVLGAVEARVQLAPLLRALGGAAVAIEAVKSPRPHSLSGEGEARELVWTLTAADVPLTTATGSKLTLDALLVLQPPQASPQQAALCSSLPVKISLSLPQQLLSGAVVSCSSANTTGLSQSSCLLLLASTAEYTFVSVVP